MNPLGWTTSHVLLVAVVGVLLGLASADHFCGAYEGKDYYCDDWERCVLCDFEATQGKWCCVDEYSTGAWIGIAVAVVVVIFFIVMCSIAAVRRRRRWAMYEGTGPLMTATAPVVTTAAASYPVYGSSYGTSYGPSYDVSSYNVVIAGGGGGYGHHHHHHHSAHSGMHHGGGSHYHGAHTHG